MTLHTYPEIDQRSEAWFDQRRGLVTASAVGKLVTPRTIKPASNDESRGLATQLAAERITGWTDPTYLSGDMIRGIEHEPFARDAYVALTGNEVTEVGFMVKEFDGFKLGFSPDGLVGDDGLLEIKCPRAKTHLSTVVSGEVPGYYMGQLQTGLLVSGREWIDFVSFVGGLPLFVKRVHPDPRWFDAILTATEQAEAAIQQSIADYQTATAGLPATDKVPDLAEMVI
jgi:predicted phage-related endonuclease